VYSLALQFRTPQILNENDCVKIKASAWLDIEVWREIHDIVRMQDLNWFANGKDTCWIKPVS